MLGDTSAESSPYLGGYTEALSGTSRLLVGDCNEQIGLDRNLCHPLGLPDSTSVGIFAKRADEVSSDNRLGLWIMIHIVSIHRKLIQVFMNVRL